MALPAIRELSLSATGYTQKWSSFDTSQKCLKRLFLGIDFRVSQFGKKAECIILGSKLEEFMIKGERAVLKRKKRRDETRYKGKEGRTRQEQVLNPLYSGRPIHRNKSEYCGSARRGAHFVCTVSQGR